MLNHRSSAAVEGWAPLTDLEICPSRSNASGMHFSASDLPSLLKVFPLLQSAKFLIRNEDAESGAVRPTDPIVHAHLRSLCLGGRPIRPELTRFLVLPSLRALFLVFSTPIIPPKDSASLKDVS